MNYSKINDHLFIGKTPAVKDYGILRRMGVRTIINMRYFRGPAPDPHHPPIHLLWLRTLDSPFFPISMRSLLHGAQVALDTIRRGGKVYVHCAYGRHRGAAMGTCILIALGMDVATAMALVKARRAVAVPDAFFIRPRIKQFARAWNMRTSDALSQG